MYAIRSNSGHPSGFRVGAVVYSGSAWKLEEGLTPEHEFAFEHGALSIVEVSSADDPALLPFAVEQGQETLVAAVSLPDLAAQVCSLQAEVDRLSKLTSVAEVSASFAAALKVQLASVLAENEKSAAEGAALRAHVADLEARLSGVAAEVANFPEIAVPSGSGSAVPA